MNDFKKLINANDLIEWIMETYPDWCVGTVRSIVDHVENMPSAEPELATDTISRQAAIDAVEQWEDDHTWDDWCNEHKDEKERFHIVPPSDYIRSLPSAEPLDAQEAYYKGKMDAFDECAAFVKKLNGEIKQDATS